LQPQKDVAEDFPHIVANGHPEGVDFVANLPLQPVFGSGFSVIFTVANDRFDGITALIAVSSRFQTHHVRKR
jgi:hypothetical protein